MSIGLILNLAVTEPVFELIPFAVTGADGYEVYMRTTKNGKSTKIATLKKASKVKYTKKGLAKNKTYYVNVRAFKKDAKGRKYYSSYSTVKAVKTK